MFKTSAAASEVEAAFDSFAKEFREIQRETLKSIFNSSEQRLRDEFGDLKKVEERKIIETVFGAPGDDTAKGIFGKAEDAFGNIQFIVDAYDDLQRKGLLKKYELDKFSRNFFRQLRDLRLVGSMINRREFVARQIEIGRTIREEVGTEKQETAKTNNRTWIPLASVNNTCKIHTGCFMRWGFLTVLPQDFWEQDYELAIRRKSTKP